MEIMNLDINILYFVCHDDQPEPAGASRYQDVLEAFADIPPGHIRAVIDAMVADGLVTLNPTETRLTVTEKGILHLQASLPCQIHPFDSCRCGRPDPPLAA